MTTTMTQAEHPPHRRCSPRANRPPCGPLKRVLPSGLQLIILAVLVLFPVGFVLLAAFTDTSPGPGSLGEAAFTLSNFKVLLTSSALSAMLNSALVGLGASIVALVIGSGMAFLAARTNVPGRKLIYFFGIAPLFLPALVGALAWAQLGSPASGFINVVARAIGMPDLINIYSFGGLIFVLGLYYAPVHVPDGPLGAVADEPRPGGRGQPARRAAVEDVAHHHLPAGDAGHRRLRDPGLRAHRGELPGRPGDRRARPDRHPADPDLPADERLTVPAERRRRHRRRAHRAADDRRLRPAAHRREEAVHHRQRQGRPSPPGPAAQRGAGRPRSPPGRTSCSPLCCPSRPC